MPKISGGKTTGNFGAWGTYSIREVDFGETRAEPINVSGTDAVDAMEFLEPDLADLPEVVVTYLFDTDPANKVPPLHAAGAKTQQGVVFTFADGKTLTGDAIGLRVMPGVHKMFDRDGILARFAFKWQTPPVYSA